jgi:hypothetical protein
MNITSRGDTGSATKADQPTPVPHHHRVEAIEVSRKATKLLDLDGASTTTTTAKPYIRVGMCADDSEREGWKC